MGLKRRLLTAGNVVLKQFGAELVDSGELERYRRIEKKFLPFYGLSHGKGNVPEKAGDYLRTDNPRLAELRARYRTFPCTAIQHSIWQSHRLNEVELPWFRGDNPYVFQFLDYNAEIAYALTAYYLETQDDLGLLRHLKEDGLFGAHTFPFNDGILLSRDLLDSVNEILFLNRQLKVAEWPGLTMLDIGAGYGRLPYRLATALPNLRRIFATDAVPESTFLCEFYMAFRNVDDRAKVIPMDEIEGLAARERIDVALNIHSFSECTLTTICWWLDLISKNGIRYLLIIPNAKHNEGTKLLTGEVDGSSMEYLKEVERRGYKRIHMSPKYLASSVQKHGVSPTHYHLFELQDWHPST